MLNPRHKLYRWGPISAYPLFMYFAIEPAFAPLKKLFGITYTESVIIFQDGKVTWLLDDKRLGEESKKFIGSVLLHPTRRKIYYTLWNNRTKKLVSLFRSLENIYFSSLSNRSLISSFEKFKKSYYDWFVITISLELGASSLEPLLGERLKIYYKNVAGTEFQKAFSTLTAAKKLTFYRKEQQDLLRINLLPEHVHKKALSNHQKKYYWIYNSYAEAKILGVSYFEEELKKLKKSDYRKTLDEIGAYPTYIRSEKEKIIKRINPKKEDKEIIQQVETLSRLLDERKMYNFRAEHYLELFTQEFARRCRKNKTDLKYLLPDELGSTLTHIDTQTITRRKKCLVFVCTPEKIDAFTDENALVIANQFLHVSNINESIIHGQVAASGENYYFRGTAKVVLTIDEIRKVKKGDILITTMTSPDFVIGMKIAGAIITDVGGMLSHAAIVSRELGIPCIVGTEIASKVIHDGDVVELHCGKGTVKIIKHSS